MSYAFSPEPLRAAIRSLPEGGAQYGRQIIDPSLLYAPFRHTQAIDPNTMLVEGSRGAGKSLWWAALLSENHRRIIAATLPKAGIRPNLEVSAGFGADVTVREAPKKDILVSLLKEFEPRQIWRTVIGWQIFGDNGVLQGRRWNERVPWVQEHVEEFESELDDVDLQLQQAGQLRLIVFDALDTAADTWEDLRRLVRGLLQVTLEFRSRRGIRLKVFVRPDMLQDPEVSSFPDASKMLTSKANLVWSRADLYGLLWQSLSNAPEGGREFRDGIRTNFGLGWTKIEQTWKIPSALRTDENLQREVFHAIAGPLRGTNRKRGFTDTWLPNHLADSFGQASPRSFQVALKTAAGQQTPHNWPYALHHDGIRSGVQEASRIRVREITEDFPWVSPAMEKLRGLVTIPCYPSELRTLWSERSVLDEIRNAAISSSKLGPRRIDNGYEGVTLDLIDLGILQYLPDGRLQMPDVYRVAFGLGRKGGVKPLR